MNPLKEQAKVIGWDDGPFTSGQAEPVPLVGVVTRGGGQVDGVVKTELTVDGMDATDKMVEAVNSSRHRDELQLVLTDGITFGGFNVVDVEELEKKTGLPILSVTRKKVDYGSIREALGNLTCPEERWSVIRKAGRLNSVEIRGGKVYYQTKSLSEKEAERVLGVTSTSSLVPEPLRLAHMIARAYVRGES
ncbi:MAG: DUF99 family protein [Candidatus Acetothermia bacterium]